MPPLFSVIVPTYNRAHSLPDSLRSLLQQSFQDFEVIIVDDGSDDNTLAQIEEFIALPKVRYVAQSNSGVARARNHGAKLANGKYILFLDSDDLVHKHWLKTFSELMADDCDLAFCSARFIYPDGKETIKNPKNLGYLYREITGIFNAGAYCVAKELFDQSGGFDPKVSFGENYELGLRLVVHSQSQQFTTEPLLFYNKAQKRDMEGLIRRIDSKKYLLAKYEDHPVLDKTRKNQFKFETQQSLAIDLIQGNRKVEGRQLLWKSVVMKPLRPKPYIRLLLSFFNYYQRKDYGHST